MKSFFKILSVALLLCTFAASCGNDSTEPEPDDKDDKIVISENTDLSPTISQDGESKTIRFTAKKPWQAYVDDNRAAADWLHVSPASGEAGEAELTITAERNETPDDRTGYVKIVSAKSQVTISVTQKQRGSDISTDRTFYELDANGGQVNVSVQGSTASTSDIKYRITQGAEWIHYTEIRAVTAQFTFNIDKNTTGEPREGEIEFTLPDKASTKVRIVQSAKVDLINIPDPNFKAYLVANFDKNKDDEISKYEASLITKIECRNKEIGSLEGIEHCTALTSLECNRNQLTALDVSKNTALTKLECGGNQLTTLDVSKNTVLTDLSCGSNQLTALDVSKNTALKYLSCGYNQLTTLDVSNNTALTELNCYKNQLTALDVSKNTALTKLECGGNQLTTLDVSKNTALTELGCAFNQLTTLDVSKNTALTKLYCGKNRLTSLDVSNNTALTELSCAFNRLTTLDVSKNTALTFLNCNKNRLATLDISKNTALTELECVYNYLTILDVSKNTALTELMCVNNELTALDVSKNTALTTLRCDMNILTTLDVSKNTALTFLRCESNRLTTLDVSKTNLIHSDYSSPLYCSPMSTLQTLYLKTGWEIDGININRSTSYIPGQTVILYKD